MRRPALRRFESLEPRLALAGLVTFSDVDGDTVTVRTSRGTDVLLSAALTLVPAGVAGGFQLQQVSLFHPSFAGTNLAITARPSATGGNGRVDVGEILTSFDLGTVTVGGDLGRIIAGDGIRATPGVAAFASASIGSRGTATGSPDTFSLVTGTVPSIRVAGDLVAARFVVAGRAADVVIGGSIFGTNGADGFEANAIGQLVVGGGVFGGTQDDSGRVLSRTGISRVVIRGDLVGGNGIASGVVISSGAIGFARIGASISGGGGENSGGVVAGGTGITRLVVGGGIFGGSNQLSGRVYSTGSIGSAVVGGSIVGSGGLLSGIVSAGAGIGTIEIGGELIGGVGPASGAVSAGGGIGTLRVSRIFAGDGPLSGYLGARSLGTIVVRGDISGSFLQPVVIAASGAATPTGPQAIGSLTVGGTMSKTLVLGGYSGTTPVNGAARIGAVIVRGSMFGSSVVAGVQNIGPPGPSGMPQFGDGLDVPIPGRRGSRIDSLVVNGAAQGGVDPVESSGVLANSIGSVRLGGRNYTVTRAGITPTSANLRFRVI